MSGGFTHGYALLVGVGESAHKRWSLPTTARDALAIRRALTDPNLCAYPDDADHVRLLRDADASRDAILDGLKWLKARAHSDGDATVVVYYSGHGWRDLANDRYYLLPHDIDPLNIPGSALAEVDFTAALREIDARRLLVILDCCHAQRMATSKTPAAVRVVTPTGFEAAAPPDPVLVALKQGEGRAVFSSARGKQRSWIAPGAKLSLYTTHLLEALQGAGNQPGDTTVRLSNVMSHVSRAVPASAKKLEPPVKQTPFFDMATEDFPIALLLGGKGLPASGPPAPPPKRRRPARPATDRSVRAGGNISGPVVTGDRNTVQQGKYTIHIGVAHGLAIGDRARVDVGAGAASDDDVDDASDDADAGALRA